MEMAGSPTATVAQSKAIHAMSFGHMADHILIRDRSNEGHQLAYRCCTEQQLHRSVAVEVKSLATDAGRAKFVQLLRCACERYRLRCGCAVKLHQHASC